MLLAVVDLGSNSFKMTVAQWVPALRSNRPFRVLHKERHPVQLGLSVFATGKMAPKSRKAALKAVGSMQLRLRDLGAPILRVVATSALREAADGRSFVDEVRERFGLSIEVISGAEEARLIAQGLEWEYPRVKRGLLVDIGGGSTEVASFGEGWSQDFLHSFRLGSVRAATQFFENRKSPDLEIARKGLRSVLAKIQAPRDIEKLVGSAGTVQSLGEILGRGSASPTLRLDRLDAWILEHSTLKASEIEKRFDLAPSRARVVIPGSLVLSEVLRWLGRDSITVTPMTLRDGLLVDLVTKWRNEERALREVSVDQFRGPLAKGFGEKLLEFLDQSASRFGLDRVRGAHRAMLATRLFDGMAEAGFDLAADERLYLFVVAYLSSCGQVVSKSGFHRHSAYILRHLDIPGFAERERDLLSLAAFYQRKDEPPKKDPLPLGVKGKSADEVRRVTALLRALLALETAGLGIADLAVRRVGDKLYLELFQSRSAIPDMKKFREGVKYFEETFDVEVVPYLHPERRYLPEGV